MGTGTMSTSSAFASGSADYVVWTFKKNRVRSETVSEVALEVATIRLPELEEGDHLCLGRDFSLR